MKSYLTKFLLLTFLLSITTMALPVTLQNATATFSQSGFEVNQASDGVISTARGWAISPALNNQTAVWETSADLSAGAITLTMHQLLGSAHILGKFRWSVTQDARSNFADGLASGGDVTANWIVLENGVATSASGLTLTSQGDHSILASGSVPTTDVYTVTYNLPFANITGFRLEALEDPSIPGTLGPGLQPTNGNFVLNEVVLDASGDPVSVVPEGSSFLLFLTSIVLVMMRKGF